jgi:hypothetical protein
VCWGISVDPVPFFLHWNREKTSPMFGNKWVKIAIGAGAVGGVVVLGTTLGRAPHVSKQVPSFSQLSDVANAQLAADRVLHVALCRLESYASGDTSAYDKLMRSIAEVVGVSNTPTTEMLRRAEKNAHVVKRCIKLLRDATLKRTSNNVEVMEDFDELATVVLSAADDKLFNLHQAYQLA